MQQRYLGAVSALTFGLVLPTQVWADWQSTKWGNTPKEVQQIYGDVVKPNADRGYDLASGLGKAKLVAPYQVGSHKFMAYFIFDKDDRLSVVALKLQSGVSCAQLMHELMAVYGPPQVRGSYGLAKWWDKATGNLVTYANLGSCGVDYSPYTSPGKPGGL